MCRCADVPIGSIGHLFTRSLVHPLQVLKDLGHGEAEGQQHQEDVDDVGGEQLEGEGDDNKKKIGEDKGEGCFFMGEAGFEEEVMEMELVGVEGGLFAEDADPEDAQGVEDAVDQVHGIDDAETADQGDENAGHVGKRYCLIFWSPSGFERNENGCTFTRLYRQTCHERS